MTNEAPAKSVKPKVKGPNLFAVLKPYRKSIIGLLALAMIANGVNLILPMIISRGIDAYSLGTFDLTRTTLEFAVATAFIFVFTYFQNIVQTYVSERVAKDLREKLSDKISRQSYAFVQKTTPSKLLTNLTSDTDAVKMFVAQAVVSIVSSLFLIVGSSILLLLIDWKLALATLTIIPLIGGTFGFVLSRIRVLFKKGQEVIDRLNNVINETIIGAALIRVINAQRPEHEKFVAANSDALGIGMRILKMFSAMIPIVTFISNMSSLIILLLGGHFVIDGSMSLGELAAFNSYITILIFPIFIIGFMSNVMARAGASYGRIAEVLDSPDEPDGGTVTTEIRGDIEVKNLTLQFGEKYALKDISFAIPAGTKTAIIGPTGAGKSQLMYLLTGLAHPTSGEILFDGKPLAQYDKASLHAKIGFVLQDSVMFNLSIRENISFSPDVTDESLTKAVDTAELREFVDALPQQLNTVVSERGSSLSGGQKQRIMLARALALNPKVLLLDDFTARVDSVTEKRILQNVAKNYPDLTLFSVTQKISSIEEYDQILVLMEGEILAKGKHEELMHTSPEYVQIFQSQQSTNAYELQSR